jgi:beta-N-acetylhexosaminidase
VPFKAAIEAGVATIMTAHVFLPALDEKRPATLSKRVITGLLREELKYDGVILSDDLEMKAVAKDYAVADAAVLAIEAGCDGVLICSGDHDTQVAALEALVHAVEQERLPLSRVEDALQRQRRAKERFLAVAAGARPLAGRALRAAIGGDERNRRRGDGPLSVMLKPRPQPGRPPRRRRPANRSIVKSSIAASTKFGARIRSRRRHRIRAAALSRGDTGFARPPCAAWRDPSIAGVIGVRGG